METSQLINSAIRRCRLLLSGQYCGNCIHYGYSFRLDNSSIGRVCLISPGEVDCYDFCNKWKQGRKE